MEAATLPSWVYTSEEFYRAEIERMFLKNWGMVGRQEWIRNAGDYFTLDYHGVSIIVVRDSSGSARAFRNSCRHRGSQIVEGEGNCKAFKCPYHSWTYSLDGLLLTTPEMDRTKNFNKSQYGLAPVKLESWDGFLFISLDSDCCDLSQHLGDLPELFACYDLEQMICVRRKEWNVAANWKLIVENAMEEYHLKTVHRTTIQQKTPMDTHSPDNEVRGECLALKAVHQGSMALLKGAEGFPPIEGLTGKASEGTYFILVFPHTTLTLTSDSVAMTERWPMGPLCTRLVHCAYFPKKIAERDDFEKIVLNYYKRWDKTLSEDIRAAERQQVGVSSAFDARGRFSYRETLVHSANNWWLDRVLGQRSVSYT